MTWQRLLVVAVVSVGCALATVGCGDSNSGNALSTEDWVTFEGESVSLMLPCTFIGGDPAVPAVMSALEDIAATNPDPARSAGLESYLQDLKNDVTERIRYQWENLGPLLVALGTPDAQGRMASVVVWRNTLRRGLLVQTGGDASMEALVGAEMYSVPESEWTLESLAENQAYVTLRYGEEEGADEVTLQHIVFILVGDSLYSFHYEFDDPANSVLEPVFRRSAETIVIEGR